MLDDQCWANELSKTSINTENIYINERLPKEQLIIKK